MNSIRRFFGKVLLLAAIFSGSAALQASDGLVVIASSEQNFAPGSIIPGGQVIELGEGQQLKLMSASGGVIDLVGPYRGSIESAAPAQDPGILRALAKVVRAAHSSDLTLAAFRNGELGQAKTRADIWGIDIGQPGIYCLRPDQPTQLWWADAVKGASLRLENLGAAESASIRWNKRAKSRAWPEAVALADGGRYRVSNDLSEQGVEFTLALMPAEFPNDAARLAWMSERGCDTQSLRLLTDLVAREN